MTGTVVNFVLHVVTCVHVYLFVSIFEHNIKIDCNTREKDDGYVNARL